MQPRRRVDEVLALEPEVFSTARPRDDRISL